MSTQITPLRQRMIEDMTIRNMSPSTQKIYAQAVANFSIYHRRSPDKLTFADVRNYRLHLIARGLKATSINPIMGALRFFYGTTLGQKKVSEQIPYARRADKPKGLRGPLIEASQLPDRQDGERAVAAKPTSSVTAKPASE